MRHAEDDDFVEAGNLYRVMTEDERRRLVANTSGGRAHAKLASPALVIDTGLAGA